MCEYNTAQDDTLKHNAYKEGGTLKHNAYKEGGTLKHNAYNEIYAHFVGRRNAFPLLWINYQLQELPNNNLINNKIIALI